MPFHNPYHFVPVKPDKLQPRPDDLSVAHFETGKVGQVTHDRYVSHTGEGEHIQPVYSGRLVCRLTTEDPLVIGDTREKLPDESHRVFPFKRDNKPAIPASTLRGLPSSLAEAASNSALRVLDNRPFSYRASLAESLPALGMIVAERDTTGKVRHKLRPLALPPLRWDSGSNDAGIPLEYQKMFTAPLLKVYVNGYQRKAGSQPPEIEYVPNSFLQRVNPDSSSADRQEFWYLQLAGTCALRGTTVMSTAPHISQGRLLGQRAVAGAQPISKAAYQNLPPDQQQQYTRGILRVLGIEGRTRAIPTTKKHEIFLPYPPGMESTPCFEVEEALKTFHTLAKERTAADETLPFHLKGSQRSAHPDPDKPQVELRPGDLVCFKPDSSNSSKVGEVAISSIWRRPIVGSSHEYFRQVSSEILPFHKDRQQLTIAEQLFGFVEQRQEGQPNSDPARALASRLRFSFGLLYPDHDDPFEHEVTLKILDSPKPPSPALYFKRNNGKGEYIAKRDLNPKSYVPQGRKFYLHRHGSAGTPWKTSDEKANPKQKSHVQPVKAGLTFYFHIDFDNASQRELSLLCYAVRPTEAFRHKLGMGKPIGLGKVRLDPVGLFFVDRQARYQETSLFEAPRYHGSWIPVGEKPETWPASYATERQAVGQGTAQFPTFDALCQSYKNTIAPDIRQALELLGDPAKVRSPVHTPHVAGVSGPEMESETYKWFVANDSGSGRGEDRIEAQQEFLEPLSASSTRLPTLPEHPWNG